MQYDPRALKITGNPRHARRLQELFKPGKSIVYNANIEIEVANKGPIDYCLWCVRTQSCIIFIDGKLDEERVRALTEWRHSLPPGLHT